MEDPQVWQDGESGRRCVLRSIDLKAVRFPENYSSSVNLAVIPDALREPEERLCFTARLAPNSTWTPFGNGSKLCRDLL